MEDLRQKAKKRLTTRQPENWRKQIQISLGNEDIQRAEYLCGHHDMNRSELFRYLMLKEEKRVK